MDTLRNAVSAFERWNVLRLYRVQPTKKSKKRNVVIPTMIQLLPPYQVCGIGFQ